MARHKDVNWSLPENTRDWDTAKTAVLMDIRDELNRLNALLHCHNFIGIPHTLTAIRKNTTKPRKRRKTPSKP